MSIPPYFGGIESVNIHQWAFRIFKKVTVFSLSFILFFNSLKHSTCLDEIIGGSPTIERFRRHLPSIARDLTTIVLIGEGGVGKSFLATHIHAASLPASFVAGPLNKRPLESLNFSILSERDQRVGLLGGEPPDLTTSRRGILEQKTTVLLKHIDYAPSCLQDKLAESLSTSTVFRLGSSVPHQLSARVILTFRNTIPMLKKKQRLTKKLIEVLGPLPKIHIPPLRDRREDIVSLARYYAMKLYDKFHNLCGVQIRGIDREGSIDAGLLELLKTQYWEDNVRDLIAFIRSLVLFPFKEEILEREKLELVKIAMMIEGEQEFSLTANLGNVERNIVTRAIQKLNNHKGRVAQLLGLSERAIGRKINLPLVVFLSLLHLDLSIKITLSVLRLT